MDSRGMSFAGLCGHIGPDQSGVERHGGGLSDLIGGGETP